MRSFPRCRLVPRLARSSRGASRSFYPVVSRCLLVLFLFVSWVVSFLISFYRLVLLARLVLLVVVSRGRLVLSPCLRPSVSPYRLTGASCLLVSFLSHSPFSSCLADLDRAFLRGGACSNINPIEVCGSFPAARSPVACPLRGHDAVSIPVLRHPVMKR